MSNRNVFYFKQFVDTEIYTNTSMLLNIKVIIKNVSCWFSGYQDKLNFDI